MKTMLAILLVAAPVFAQGKTAPVKPAAAAATAKPTVAPAKAVPAATGFVGNKDSKLCHKADCKGIAKMKESNKVAFASAADAQKAGYKACKICKPF